MRLTGLIFILLSFLGHVSCGGGNKGNFFSGTIEYSYSYSSDLLNKDSLTKTRPVKGIFRYDEINYQSRFLGKDTFTHYYSGRLNKCVSETGTQHNYECQDYGNLTDSVLSITLYDTDEKIAGHACRILEMQKGGSWVRYYISREIKIAPATYRLHRSFNWDVYGEKAAGGLILKSEHRFKNFTMHGITTALKEYDKGFEALELDEKKIVELCR